MNMTNDYSVRKGPFIIKLVICSIYMLAVISMVIMIPDEIRDDVYYSGDEYHLSNLNNDRNRRRFDDIYMELDLYNLTEEQYDEYWELVNGYRDYVLYSSYRNANIKGYTLDGAEDSEKLYKDMVLHNADNTVYEGNARYLRELADMVQNQE